DTSQNGEDDRLVPGPFSCALSASWWLLASFFLQQADLFLQSGHDAALGEVDGRHSQAERLGDLLSGLAVDGRPPEGLPGRLVDAAADPFGGPGEDAPPVLLVPGRFGGGAGGRLLFEAGQGCRVAAALFVGPAAGEEVAQLVADDREEP